MREFTARAVITGAILGMVFGASSLYLVLVTNKGSNIVEDLDTLRLLSRVVPEQLGLGVPLTEDNISARAFELLFAFDEVLASGGYRDHRAREAPAEDDHGVHVSAVNTVPERRVCTVPVAVGPRVRMDVRQELVAVAVGQLAIPREGGIEAGIEAWLRAVVARKQDLQVYVRRFGELPEPRPVVLHRVRGDDCDAVLTRRT
jgi:hypothetical protein